MARRPLTAAAVRKQLKTVDEKLAGTATGQQRLALLRRQAELGDQHDAAADKAGSAKHGTATLGRCWSDIQKARFCGPFPKRLKGLEPSTFCMASRRSSQLSYSRSGGGV
jgi:hypothetical protein